MESNNEIEIDPWRMFYGPVVPLWLYHWPELSAGAKLCYGRLVMYKGEHGECRPSVATLAKELSVSERQVQRYLDELTLADLIRRVQLRPDQTSRIKFLLHKRMIVSENGVTYMTPRGVTQVTPDGVTDMTPEKNQGRKESGITHVIPGDDLNQRLVSSKQADFKLDARSLPDDISEVIEAWEGQLSLPRVRTFAGKRAGSIRRALKDPFWREHWRDALSKLIKTPLLMGKGKISWRADLDWFLEPRNIEKLINGVYDDPNQKPPTRDYTRETI